MANQKTDPQKQVHVNDLQQNAQDVQDAQGVQDVQGAQDVQGVQGAQDVRDVRGMQDGQGEHHSAVIADEQQFHLQVYGRYPVVLERGEGVWVWDDEGNRYLDMLSGIAVNNTGHCHPHLVNAIREQAGKLIHTSNFYYNEPQSRLVRKLAELSGLDRIFLCNSGVEAMEGALKMARRYGNRKGKSGPILAAAGGFHGRSIAAIALGKEKYRKGFEPIPPGFATTPYNDIEALREVMNDDVVALAFEPLQGEGGIHAVSEAFMREARSLCDRHDVLLIMDEVQCGNGRTGSYFFYQQFDVQPDIVVTAKGVGGGFPVGAVMMTQAVADAMEKGSHGTTYGGNPLASAAALAAIEVLEDGGLIEGANERGAWFMEGLRKRVGGHPLVRDIRGVGLMIGVELTVPGRPIVEGLLKRKILSNVTMDCVIRILPPLLIEKPEMDLFINALAECLEEL